MIPNYLYMDGIMTVLSTQQTRTAATWKCAIFKNKSKRRQRFQQINFQQRYQTHVSRSSEITISSTKELENLLSHSSKVTTAASCSIILTFSISPPPFRFFWKWIVTFCSSVPGGRLRTTRLLSIWSSVRRSRPGEILFIFCASAVCWSIKKYLSVNHSIDKMRIKTNHSNKIWALYSEHLSEKIILSNVTCTLREFN